MQDTSVASDRARPDATEWPARMTIIEARTRALGALWHGARITRGGLLAPAWTRRRVPRSPAGHLTECQANTKPAQLLDNHGSAGYSLRCPVFPFDHKRYR